MLYEEDRPRSGPRRRAAADHRARGVPESVGGAGTGQASPGDQQTFTAGGVSFAMVYVPGGAFPTGMDDTGVPATVPDGHWIGQTVVTYELWSTVYLWAAEGTAGTGAGQYSFANEGRQGGDSGAGPVSTDQHPVTTINWRDAMVWCNALTEWYNANTGASHACVYKDVRAPIRDAGNFNPIVCDSVVPDAHATGFRLLTIDEWELAARWRTDATNTVDGFSDPWFTKGDSASGPPADISNAPATTAVAWYAVNSGVSTRAVAGRTANSLGLYDTSGNVAEWGFTPAGFGRLLSGGWWGSETTFLYMLAIGNLENQPSSFKHQGVGFRLAKSP